MPLSKLQFDLKTLLAVSTITAIWIGYLGLAYRLVSDDSELTSIADISNLQLLGYMALYGFPYFGVLFLVYWLLNRHTERKWVRALLSQFLIQFFVWSIVATVILTKLFQDLSQG